MKTFEIEDENHARRYAEEAIRDHALAEAEREHCNPPTAYRAHDEHAELTSLRRMREALVKLRDQLATEDTEEMAAADRITEVLAMSAAPVEQQPAASFAERLLALWSDAHEKPPSVSARDFAAWSGATKDILIAHGLQFDGESYRIEQAPAPMPMPAGLDPSGAAICERPFGCVACQGPPTPLSEHRRRTIDALLTLVDAHAGSTKDAGAIEQLAHAVALLAGAPL